MSDLSLPLNFFYASPGMRVIAACSQWLYCPLERWLPALQPNDYVVLLDWNQPWNLPPTYWRDQLGGIDPARVFFLSSTTWAHEARLADGLQTWLVSNNMLCNEHVFDIAPTRSADYDALYVARAAAFKRIGLAAKVDPLALVVNRWFQSRYAKPDEAYLACRPAYLNEAPLSAAEVAALLNRSRTALALSTSEGACFGVVEALLCGTPVVSTKPKTARGLGGRELWLSDTNALYVDPDEDAVAAGVKALAARGLDPAEIRREALALLTAHRLIVADDILAPLFRRHGEPADARALMMTECWRTSSHRHRLAVEGTDMKLSTALERLASPPRPEPAQPPAEPPAPTPPPASFWRRWLQRLSR